MKQLVFAQVAVVAALSIAPANAEDMNTLYQAAKGEGMLVLYGGGPTSWYEPWASEFEKTFPGIKVIVKAGPGLELVNEIDSQLAAEKLTVDVVIQQSVQDYERWKANGQLLPFKPDGFDMIDAEWKDVDGAYVGITVHGLSYAYNAQQISATQVPRSALDFLKPEFKGKIITSYPHVDDVTLYVYQTIVEKYGSDFLEKLKANEPSFVRGHLGIARAIAAGNERTVTFDAFVNMTLAEAKAGKPITIAMSDIDPMPVYAQMAAVFQRALHPNAAKLFINWYLQPQQQARQGSWSSRSDVAPPRQLKPLTQYQLANRFREFVMDEAKLKSLREHYLGFTGPVRAPGVYR